MDDLLKDKHAYVIVGHAKVPQFALRFGPFPIKVAMLYVDICEALDMPVLISIKSDEFDLALALSLRAAIDDIVEECQQEPDANAV